MESIIRAVIMYFFLMVIIRVSGARTLSEMTLFDFVLLLIIGDCSQQAITGNDYSIINALIVIVTLVLIDSLLTFLKDKFPKIDRIIEGKPVIIVIEGKAQTKIMDELRITEDDVLESARKSQGLLNLEQIKFAILERDGNISIIPQAKLS